MQRMERLLRSHLSRGWCHLAQTKASRTKYVYDMNLESEVSNVSAEDEWMLASFTGRLIEIAAAARTRGSGTSPTTALNAMRLPAIALDRCGLVLDVNAAADAVFDKDIRIKDNRLFIRDPEARALLKATLDELTNPVKLKSLITSPITVHRSNNSPVMLRIWPYKGQMHLPEQDVYALLTLNALDQSHESGQLSAVTPLVLNLWKRRSPASSLPAAPPVSPPETENRVVPLRKNSTEHVVAHVPGGAVLGFDKQVHLDLDRTHTVLTPEAARQFADELKKIADAVDPPPGRKRGE